MLLGALLGVAALYSAGVLALLVYALRTKPWRVEPMPDRWPYTWWGIPLAVALAALVWPVGVIRELRR